MGSEVVCVCVCEGDFFGVNSSSLHDRDTCWERRGKEKKHKKKLSALQSQRFRFGFSLLRNFQVHLQQVRGGEEKTQKECMSCRVRENKRCARRLIGPRSRRRFPDEGTSQKFCKELFFFFLFCSFMKVLCVLE